MVRSFAAASVAAIALAACSGGGTSSGSATGQISTASPKPTPTPVPYRDVTLTFGATSPRVGSVGDCEAISKRARVPTFGLQTGTGAVERMFGVPAAACWRAVRTTDSAFASAAPAGIYVPHLKVGADARIVLTGAQRPADTVIACLQAGARAHVPALAYQYFSNSAWEPGKKAACFRPAASDDSSADSAKEFTIRIPGPDIAQGVGR